MDTIISRLASTRLVDDEPRTFIRPKMKMKRPGVDATGRAGDGGCGVLPDYLHRRVPNVIPSEIHYAVKDQGKGPKNFEGLSRLMPLPVRKSRPISDWKSYLFAIVRVEKTIVQRAVRQYKIEIDHFVRMCLVSRQRQIFEHAIARFRGDKSTRTEPQFSRNWRLEGYKHLAVFKAEVERCVRIYSDVCESLSEMASTHRALDQRRAAFRAWAAQVPEKPKHVAGGVPDFEDLLEAQVKVKVKTPDGTKYELRMPYADLHRRWHAKGRRPPADRVVQAFAQLGFPMTYLQNILKIHDNEKKMKPKIEEFIERVFDKVKKKRSRSD